MSSSYDNVVGGKLKLKGKALDVKMKKKKKTTKKKPHMDLISQSGEEQQQQLTKEEEEEDSAAMNNNKPTADDHNLTPAERRYMEQRDKINSHKLAKTSNKSHRDRIQDFNQYLANMSEHYDIPKVGPG